MDTQKSLENKGVDFLQKTKSLERKFAELLFWKHNPELTQAKLEWDEDTDEYISSNLEFKDQESKIAFYRELGFEFDESDVDYEEWESDVEDETISASDIIPPTYTGSTDDFCSLFDECVLTRPENFDDELNKLEKLFDQLLPLLETVE